MLILSIGMPRAGSGWYYNLTHDLVTTSGGQDARLIRQRYHLGRILTEVNCNIGALTPHRLGAVLVPSLLGNTFVIKAHAGPTPSALRLIQRGLIRPAYIYRDPRDALLSAYDNGQRALQKGHPNAFSHLTDFDKAVDFMLEYLRIYQAWMGVSQALHTRFESLLTDYDTEVQRLVDSIKLDSSNPELKKVVDKYRPGQVLPGQKGTHFNQGRIGRFRQKTTPEQQQLMAERFAPYLSQMGYAI